MADPALDDDMIGTQLPIQSQESQDRPVELQTQPDEVAAESQDIQTQPKESVQDDPEESVQDESMADDEVNDAQDAQLEASILDDVQPEQQEPEDMITGVQDVQEDQIEEEDTMTGIEHDQQKEQNVTASHQHEPNDAITEQPQDDRAEREESSLFIPEEHVEGFLHSDHPSRPASVQPSTSKSSTARAPSRPAPSSLSTFAKIRNMQKQIQKRKLTAIRSIQPSKPNLDPEAYLEAVCPSTADRTSSENVTATNDDEKADRMAAIEFQKQKKRYDDMLKSKGRLSFREEVEWMRIQKAEQRRQAKKQRDMAKDKDDEADLFPEPASHRNESDEEYLDPDPAGARRRTTMPGKEPNQFSIQDAELQSMRVALEAASDAPKKRKRVQSACDVSAELREPKSRGRPKGSSSKASGSANRRLGKTSGKRGRRTAKEKQATDQAVRQATSLFNSDVFRQQASENAPLEPTFKSRNRTDALKEMLASVPEDRRKSVNSDKHALLAALKEFDGRGAVKATNGMWLVKGMRTPLKGYQVMGSSFMRLRENAVEEPRGGLMADQMGLGKTLMMLANIVNGHPGKRAERKTTLLVAAPALLTQWAREIDLHTDAGFLVMKYSSGTRIDSNRADEILYQHDIILTTYQEVMKSYPKNEPPIQYQTAEQKIDWWKEEYETMRGTLHRMMFHRVVLDEAQSIKNHTSRTSLACRALMARHKWALSGTPIQNGLTELYPYFKFLNVPHTGSFKVFKHNYCDAGNRENGERLLFRLSQFMIRRTHADEMFGAPILKLPKADQITHWAKFNAVERRIYDIVSERFAAKVNTMANRGELEKGYSSMLVMLLRLRQLTSHVLMLQFVMRDLLEQEDILRIEEVVKDAAAKSNEQNARTIIAIRQQLETHAAEERTRTARNAKKPSAMDDEDDLDDEDEELGTDNDSTQTDERYRSGRNFGKEYNFRPFLCSLKTGESWKKAKEKAKCSACKNHPKAPMMTSCGHLICQDCYEHAFMEAAEEGKSQSTCGGCGSIYSTAELLDSDQEDFEMYSAPETRSRKKRHDKERRRIEEQDIGDDWLQLGSEGVLPSAKTIAVKAQVLNWIKENKDVKIIVYTQFLAMIRILDKALSEEGWKSEQYHGKLSFGARDKTITNFADNPNVRVLLASLRCGGLGLNLTMASRVIVLDPWWNSAAEQQAFCRVFRFGQTETTFLTRFCIQNTVDERLIEMQKRKQTEIDEVMENHGEKAKKMSIRDLMRLFGNIHDDENGRPFIMVENPDPRGGFRADQDHEGFADEA